MWKKASTLRVNPSESSEEGTRRMRTFPSMATLPPLRPTNASHGILPGNIRVEAHIFEP
ncbi:unnamed protein product [Ectocarpus sp. 6 AP-2014]